MNLQRRGESGFALVAALIILILLGVISITVLAFSTSETRTAKNEIKRIEAFYAAEAKLEEMTNRFNKLFQNSSEPLPYVLNDIATTNSPSLNSVLVIGKGYDFTGSNLALDTVKAAQLIAIFGTDKPFIQIPDGPYKGMSATVTPYYGIATATEQYSGTSVSLRRDFNSYLLPIFQFSLFSDGDIELDPGKAMYISGRVHANKNVYPLRNLLFTGNITAAGELVRDRNRGGGLNNKTDVIGVNMMVTSPSSGCTPSNICIVPFVNGGTKIRSVIDGPDFYTGPAPDLSKPLPRGYHPGSPVGTPVGAWDTNSILAPNKTGNPNNGTPGRFNKQVLTASSSGLGIEPLTLPLGLDEVKAVELIKRKLPNVDTDLISSARYHTKAQIRILIDDEVTPLPNEAGISSGGVPLSSFVPTQLGSGDCNALRIFDNSGSCSYNDNGPPTQKDPNPTYNGLVAQTVRSVKNLTTDTAPNGAIIPPGSGIQGRIKIEVVDTTGVAKDVTREILSMGVTIGEPNAIVRLQRPLWAAFMQDSFDRSAGQSALSPTLFNLQYGDNGEPGRTGKSGAQMVDGEITTLDPTNINDIDSSLGYITKTLSNLKEDATSAPEREAILPSVPTSVSNPLNLNAIVPINVYNVREGWINRSQDEFRVYRRGVTSVIDINMRNLARWLDGKFDNNLFSSMPDVQSINIGTDKGYVVYISDRRGDKVRTETTNASLVAQGKPPTPSTTNGNVDNEDVYFTPVAAPGPPVPTTTLDVGEDVIINSVFINNLNTLQKDVSSSPELPDSLITSPYTPWDALPTTVNGRILRAIKVMSWRNDVPAVENYFRRSVRLSNGEDLTTTCSPSSAPVTPPTGVVVTWTCNTGSLGPVKGITIASENMVYVAGNYNTKGVGRFRDGGSTLNNGTDFDYLGPQIPTSIICDAFFPLSKTWFDANAAMYPEGNDGGRTFNVPPIIYRAADAGSMTPDYLHPSADSQETAVRTAVMFGSTLSALSVAGAPARDSLGTISSGGMHSAPRFLELWNNGTLERHWSFTGSMVTLFNSTQAFAPWESGVAYTPPVRNWSYDSTFSNPNRLPPGTPFFQYVQSSGFEQIINR